MNDISILHEGNRFLLTNRAMSYAIEIADSGVSATGTTPRHAPQCCTVNFPCSAATFMMNPH